MLLRSSVSWNIILKNIALYKTLYLSLNSDLGNLPCSSKEFVNFLFCYGFCAESSFIFCLIAKNFVKINDFSYVTLIFTSWNCGWSFFVLSVNCCSRGQKQPSRGVLRKRCSENMQQIYSRTPMPKSHSGMGVFL